MTRQRYLLDTCICIAWLRDKFGIRERINTVGFDNCCISEMTVAEKMIMVTETLMTSRTSRVSRLRTG